MTYAPHDAKHNIYCISYSISNGVKQGGCLSPTLFSIYLNYLMYVLRSSNIGSKYGNHYMGVYCYADDIGLCLQLCLD